MCSDGKQRESDNVGIFLSCYRWMDPRNTEKNMRNNKINSLDPIQPHSRFCIVFKHFRSMYQTFKMNLKGCLYSVLWYNELVEIEPIAHISSPSLLVYIRLSLMFRNQHLILVYGMGSVGKQKKGKIWNIPVLLSCVGLLIHPRNTRKKWNPRNLHWTQNNRFPDSA